MESRQVAAAAGLVGGLVAVSLTGQGGGESDEREEVEEGVACPECDEFLDARGMYPHLHRGHNLEPEEASDLTEMVLEND